LVCINFTPSINQNIELWAVVTNEFFYIRKLDMAVLLSRYNNSINYQIVDKYDDIFKRQSSYAVYADEYEKIFLYKKNIVMDDRVYFMDCSFRNVKSKVYRYFFIILDICKMFFIKKI
jgi:hypothetical protein